jgi:hypothetical protein
VFTRTSVKSASGGNCHRENALTPEVARDQSVHDCATFAFAPGAVLAPHAPANGSPAKHRRRADRSARTCHHRLHFSTEAIHRIRIRGIALPIHRSQQFDQVAAG